MPDRKTRTFCGRASQFRRRKAAALKVAAAEKLAAVRAAPLVLVRWLHQHPDTLTTGASLIALASFVILIASGA